MLNNIISFHRLWFAHPDAKEYTDRRHTDCLRAHEDKKISPHLQSMMMNKTTVLFPTEKKHSYFHWFPLDDFFSHWWRKHEQREVNQLSLSLKTAVNKIIHFYPISKKEKWVQLFVFFNESFLCTLSLPCSVNLAIPFGFSSLFIWSVDCNRILLWVSTQRCKEVGVHHHYHHHHRCGVGGK